MKKLFVITLLVSIFFVIPSPVIAHVLKTSNTIGAVIHVTPDDDPIAGERSDFYFEFKDTKNTFSLKNCDCRAIVLDSEQEIFSQPLNAKNATAGNFSFTFPKRNVYTIKITGKPLQENTFSPFTLTYDIRVDRSAPISDQHIENKSFFTNTPYYAIAGIGLGVGIFFFRQRKTSKKTKHK